MDYNGHMNDVYYGVVCAEAAEVFLSALGVGREYQAETGRTTYTVESHLRYLREVLADEVLRVETLLVDADEKRVRVHHTLRNRAGEEVATGEYLYLHVNQDTGRVEPMPEGRRAVLRQVLAAHATCGRPPHLGRGVGERSPGSG
jgi:acyl-CoA thioesterase FadM